MQSFVARLFFYILLHTARNKTDIRNFFLVKHLPLEFSFFRQWLLRFKRWVYRQMESSALDIRYCTFSFCSFCPSSSSFCLSSVSWVCVHLSCTTSYRADLQDRCVKPVSFSFCTNPCPCPEKFNKFICN